MGFVGGEGLVLDRVAVDEGCRGRGPGGEAVMVVLLRGGGGLVEFGGFGA